MIARNQGSLSFDTITEAAFMVDQQMRLVMWNERMEKLTKLVQDEVLGKGLLQVSGLFSPAWFTGYLENALAGHGGLSPFSLSFDSTQEFTPAFIPTAASGDNAVACLVIFHRSYVNLPKKEKDSRYKPLIEESPVATAIYRPDGTPKYYNRAYGTIWGASPEVGRKLVKSGGYNILKDEQLDELGLGPFLEKGFGGETADIPCVAYNPAQTKALKPFGLETTKYIKGHIFPVKDEMGEIEEVAVVISDVTFQMQAEEILTENHLKFQLLTMGLPGVIYEYEYEEAGNRSIFKYISQGCIEMFGYSPEEILHESTLIQSLVHPDDVDQFKRTSDFCAQNAIKWEWEGRFIVNGQTKWIEGTSDTRGSNPNIRYGM
ncbi:MAG: PAS domain-containing protein, partial [Cytophagales bacterium]|nr:PAS domain-containing protein [Cytophagales bacterium]